MSESMRWTSGEMTTRGVLTDLEVAYEIVAWIKCNGGEARYEPGSSNAFGEWTPDPCIVITGPDGKKVIARPGDTIVMGDEWFPDPAKYGMCAGATTIHEFTVEKAS